MSEPTRGLVERFGSAKHPERPIAKESTSGADDATIDAVGKLSAAWEVAENARGHLYEFHRMSGQADLALQDALEALRDAGHVDIADEIDEALVGRDVIPGLWTFQIIEAYDEQYWQVFRAADERVRELLVDGQRHLFEARMKREEQA
jgi:hypothetical protein